MIETRTFNYMRCSPHPVIIERKSELVGFLCTSLSYFFFLFPSRSLFSIWGSIALRIGFMMTNDPDGYK